MRSSSQNDASRLRATFSDDDVLAVICQLGSRAEAHSVCETLNVRTGKELDLGAVERRFRRLREEGLLRFVPGAAHGHVHARQTAAGVERLQSLQREPVRAARE